MSQQQPDSESPAKKHKVETPPDEALKYWTADKMRKAKPAPMPHVNAPGGEKQPPQSSPSAPDPQKP